MVDRWCLSSARLSTQSFQLVLTCETGLFMSQIYGIKRGLRFQNHCYTVMRAGEEYKKSMISSCLRKFLTVVKPHFIDPCWKLQIEFHDCKSLGK